MALRLVLNEIDKRVETSLDKSISTDGVYGIIKFGEKNDYPQIMERIILSSIDAKVIASIYARFLVGDGFENEAINSIVIGKDGKGKNITMLSLLRQHAYHASLFRGGYIHTNFNLLGEVVNARSVAFKDCRLSAPDSSGYSSKIAVYDNWQREKNKKYNKENIKFYDIFNTNKEILKAQFEKYGGIGKHKGQIYAHYLDEAYLYPLSPFDPVYLDCDTQSQIAIFKNNQIRNGFTDKTIFRVAGDANAVETIAGNLKKMMGADGDNCTVLEDTINPETGKLDQESQVVADEIKTNINSKLFESWESSITNNVRKANNGLPAILIDYETSQLGNTSGEAIIQAVAFYNAMTKDDRGNVSDVFKEIFSNSINPILKANTNWKIKPLTLIAPQETTV